MGDFKITDRRGLRPQLITKNLSSEMSAIRNQGTTPSHPQRKQDYVEQVESTVAKRGLGRLVQASDRHGAATPGEQQVISEMRSNRMQRTASDLTMAMPKQRRPLESLKSAGIPTSMEKESDRAELRGWARAYYATHYLVPLCIDIYARFPLQGMELTCFAAETEVLTRTGTRLIGDLAGEQVELMTTGGRWVTAPVMAFGQQSLRAVTVRRNGREKVIYTTGSHRWFVSRLNGSGRAHGERNANSKITWEQVQEIRSMYATGACTQKAVAAQFGISQVMVGRIVRGNAWQDSGRGVTVLPRTPISVEVKTDDLTVGDSLVGTWARSLVRETNPSPFGIAHGVTWGDGSRATSGGGCFVDLFGSKDAAMLKYFQGCTVYDYGLRDGCNVASLRVASLPAYFKALPSIDESTSYLYGFLAGWFAADGTVSRDGNEAYLSHVGLDGIKFARAVCQRLGIKTYGHYTKNVKNVPLPGGGTVEDYTIYCLPIDVNSLTEAFFCIEEHKRRWQNNTKQRTLDTWKVVSVEDTDRVEEVYCAVVPGTEAFVLEDNILTGNCKDPELTKFYEQLFFDDLDYENFLVDMGREFWTVGEVNSLANFNEVLGVWDSEEIINPDDIEAQFSPFEKDPRIKLGIPLYLRELINNPEQSQKWEAEIIRRDFPEIVTAISQDKKLDVSPVLMSRIINRMSPWDVYGTPHMLRGFKLLMMEESLNAAQDAVADRLYAPFILAKLGIQDMGDGGGPWIPNRGELDNFRDDMNQALSADFKLMVHHFGVDIKSVFGREAMPRFDGDYDRIERKLLQIWGIGESLISGSNQGSYASSALNRDLVTQLMSSYQKWIIRHYKKRALIVAEAQGHFDYESSGGMRVPIYEEIYEVDEETGEERVVERPKLLIPDLKFRALSLQDESTERSFLQTLKSSGFPISDHTLAVNIPIDFDEELEKVQDEKVMKIVAEAEVKKKAEEVLKSRNLPVPDEVRDPKELAKEKAKEQEKAMKAQQAITGVPVGAGDVAGADADDTPDKAVADVTSPPKTPNVAPVDDTAKDDTTKDDTKPDDADKDTKSKDKKLPRSKTRPAISDEKKKNAPKPNKKTARFDRSYTASQGWRDGLTREEVEDIVNGGL